MKYIYFENGNTNGNYIVSEEKSFCPDGICIDFFVHRIDDDTGNTGIIVRSCLSQGQLMVGTISVLPEYRGLGIESVLMDALASRFRLPCVPPSDPDDYEAAVWTSYQSRSAEASSPGYLQEIPD